MTDTSLPDFRAPRRRVFNPLRLTDEEVEQTFIARQALFESIMGDIGAETGERRPQHHLIVGQRGMGKTMLMCRIAAELRKADHCDRLLPLSFPEEQYVEIDRLSKFWLNCLDAMADALEARGDGEAAGELDAEIRRLECSGEDEDELAEQTRKYFRTAIDQLGQRPVLLLDNLHLLLRRLRKHDYVLRGFFTGRGAPVLVGAATVMPADLQDYGAAFYDSFKTHVLHRLSVDEMRSIISQLARAANRPDVAARLHAELPRLRVLRELTGGNPRTTVLLFELLAQGFSDDPYEDLEALLDQITPLYQSRVDQLSEQGQLIFGALARHWSPATAEQLTGLTRLPRGSISPQLGRLEDIGLVEKTPIFPGKKTGYQIAERFFNIWYLMRFASRRQRSALICLTRFLQAFYTPPELADRARRLLAKSALSGGEAVYALALAEAQTPETLAHDLRAHAELAILDQAAGIRERVAEIIDPADLTPQALDFDEQRRRLRSLIPKDSPVSGEQFAEIMLACISFVPPHPDIDRRAIAAQPSLSREQIEGLVEIAEGGRNGFIDAYSEEAVTYVQDRLRRGTLAARDDREGLRSAIEQATTTQAATLLGDFAAMTGACLDESEQAYRKAIELDPKSASPWNGLGNLLKNHLDRYDESEQAYRKAIEVDPKSARPWNGLGNLLQDHLDRYDESEQAYRKAIELDPKFAHPWHGLGNLLQDHLDRYDESEQAYRKAIELDPKFAHPWNGLGNLLQIHLDRYDESEQAYRKAMELDPKFAYPWNGLGSLLKNHLDRYDESEQAYRKAMELDPEFAYPWHNLGNLLQIHLDRYDESEQAYRKAMELDPKFAYPWHNLGNLLQIHLDRYDESEQAYRKAIELDPKFAHPWHGLGNLLQDHLDRYDESEKAYRKAIEVDLKSASPWNGLGKLLKDHLDRYDESEQAYRKAMELDPKFASPWNGLGNLLMDFLRRPLEAREAYQRAIEIEPAEDSPRHNLSFLLRDLLDDPSGARQVLSELKQTDTWKDTQALHEALFAAHEDNWGTTREFLRKALAEVGDGLPTNTREDWCRSAAVILHLGFGEKLVELLEQEGADVRLMPWFEAVRAHVLGDERHLRNIPAEARDAAREIYAAIDRWKKLLPR